MSVEFKVDLFKMFLWAMRKAMENHPSEVFNLNDLKKEIENVWDSLIRSGEITLLDDD